MERTHEHSDINEKGIYLKNIYPVGCVKRPKHLQKTYFKVSNDWLDIQKKQYNIRQVNGESSEASGATVDSWKERLTELLQVTTFGTLTNS